MIQKISILFLILFISPNLWSKDVLKLRGKVKLNGKSLKEGDKITESGLITTEEKSFIRFKKWGNVVVIGPKSKMQINLGDLKKSNKAKSRYEFQDGICRWVSTNPKKKVHSAVRTKAAVFGVRGTNFTLMRSELLNESEIVLFDGEVQMISQIDASDIVSIKPGQWGGVGGRFGQKIKIMDLPQNILDSFDQKL